LIKIVSEEDGMADELDDFARALQNQIYKETQEAYGQVAFERWLKPLYVGVLPNPEGACQISKGTNSQTMAPNNG
jgi:hypothetical protein